MAEMDLVNFDGEAASCEAIRYFAGNFIWSSDMIEDPEFSVDEIIAELRGDEPLNEEAVAMLRGALIASAEKHNARER